MIEKNKNYFIFVIVRPKDITKQNKRKEKTMPGDTNFIITPKIKSQIITIIDERIGQVHVTKEDFSELKSIVRELAEAQKRTESRVEELAVAQKELAEAQKRTEGEIEKLTNSLKETWSQLGGLSRSFSYAFENEAYRNIPKLLNERFGYEVKEKIVRAEIGGKEINFFCKAIKDGREIYIVGESKVRLDDSIWRREVFLELEEKIDVLRKVYGDIIIQPILVTHFATEGFLKEADEKGIIVIQSYEW